MRLWNWAYHKGSLVGSATTVANRDTKLQSIGVVVKHHALTDNSISIDYPKTIEALKR